MLREMLGIGFSNQESEDILEVSEPVLPASPSPVHVHTCGK